MAKYKPTPLEKEPRWKVATVTWLANRFAKTSTANLATIMAVMFVFNIALFITVMVLFVGSLWNHNFALFAFMLAYVGGSKLWYVFVEKKTTLTITFGSVFRFFASFLLYFAIWHHNGWLIALALICTIHLTVEGTLTKKKTMTSRYTSFK